jgi:hypothetical protein
LPQIPFQPAPGVRSDGLRPPMPPQRSRTPVIVGASVAGLLLVGGLAVVLTRASEEAKPVATTTVAKSSTTRVSRSSTTTATTVDRAPTSAPATTVAPTSVVTRSREITAADLRSSALAVSPGEPITIQRFNDARTPEAVAALFAELGPMESFSPPPGDAPDGYRLLHEMRIEMSRTKEFVHINRSAVYVLGGLDEATAEAQIMAKSGGKARRTVVEHDGVRTIEFRWPSDNVDLTVRLADAFDSDTNQPIGLSFTMSDRVSVAADATVAIDVDSNTWGFFTEAPIPEPYRIRTVELRFTAEFGGLLTQQVLVDVPSAVIESLGRPMAEPGRWTAALKPTGPMEPADRYWKIPVARNGLKGEVVGYWDADFGDSYIRVELREKAPR